MRITRPEPGSLYDIMHEHSGESLFIIPICWTDAHARLLGVTFVDRDPVRKPVPDFNSVFSKYPPRPSRIATELSKDLTTILSSKSRPFGSQSIKQAMRTFFPTTLSKAKSDVDLELRFGNHTLKRAVRVAVLWKHPDSPGCSFDSATTKPMSSYDRIPSSSRKPSDSQISDWSFVGSQPPSDRPILAFVNRTHLTLVRRTLYRVMPGPQNGDQQNTPVSNLQKLRSKRLVPEDSDHDSYLVAIMTAIAQSQCYPSPLDSASRSSSQKSSQGSSGPTETSSLQPEFRDVLVRILSQDNDAAEFVVYNTIVTAAFLKRFSEPTKSPSADDLFNGGLEVDVTRVPIWPVLGLKERLAKALGTEIAGAECSQAVDAEIETWESEQERKMRLSTLKRRREALSDVFNTSFDSTDGGSPGMEPSSSVGIGSAMGITVASPPLSPRTPKRRRTQAINELEVC